MSNSIEQAYASAKDRYAQLGVDTESALERLSRISISLHCWQGDDVSGFETPDAKLTGGGIQVTGNYPGKARTPDELRADLEKAFSLIPGSHRVNLHAIYGEFGGKRVDRDEIEPGHFQGWVDWAASQNLKLDFNPTCFSHPMAADGYTLSHQDAGARDFWVRHVNACREIAAYMGEALGGACIHNLWIPDGSKDIPVDRKSPRERLKDSMDRIYSTAYSPAALKDAVECKLFGIGSESYVVGSQEFYMGYALNNGMMLCLDLGHFHPTESVADKISSVLLYSDEVLLHVSRGVRWDSDHVVILNDDVQNLAHEIVRNGPERVHIALDYFDATLNRVGAWVIGTRSTLRALLHALLEPTELLKQYEQDVMYFQRLALMEEMKSMPVGDVWRYYCAKAGVPAGTEWMDSVREYEEKVTGRR